MSLTQEVNRRATELGFCAVGVTGAERFSQAEAAAVNRTQEGLMDGLAWWSEARAHASADPRRATPDARSVIALAFPHAIFPSPSDEPQFPVPARGGGPGPPAHASRAAVRSERLRRSGGGPQGRIAAYALGRDYHEVLLERMQPLVAMLRERGHVAKTYVDHGWMLDRAAAARAGLGWLGKNTNLLIPGVGSYVLLAEIVTSAELEPDQPLKKTCGSCDACMRVCPTGALVEPGVLDNRRCISFWTIEHRGVIPLDIRPLIGDWIFGCDLCQEICPVNARPRRAEPDPAPLRAYRQRPDSRPVLEELLGLDEPAFRTRFRGSAVWRTRRGGLLRNVCVALGNVGDRSSVPALAATLGHPDPIVRGHAAWALGRLGGAAARRHLEAAISAESDPFA